MNLPTWIAAVMALTWAGAARTATVGFETAAAPVAGDKALQVFIWYPSTEPEKTEPLALGQQSVAHGGAMAPGRHPLIVISHGTGGSGGDHFDTAQALARAGFVVAAISHTGDTYSDHSRALRIAERPAQLIQAIDYMTGAWRSHDALDAQRIGAFGFSSGGFTVLAAIGSEPDLNQISQHCARHPHFYDCGMQRQFGGFPAGTAAAVSHDPRIRAAVVAAPALGFAFAPSGLTKVAIPVQLWRAEWDTVLPQPFYAQAVRDALPKPPEYHVVAGADHFDFLPTCSAGLAKAAPSICGDGVFDRAAFHARFTADVVRFFEKTLR